MQPYLALITPLNGGDPVHPAHPIAPGGPYPAHPIAPGGPYPSHPIAPGGPGAQGGVYPGQLPGSDPSGSGWVYCFVPGYGWMWAKVIPSPVQPPPQIDNSLPPVPPRVDNTLPPLEAQPK